MLFGIYKKGFKKRPDWVEDILSQEYIFDLKI